MNPVIKRELGKVKVPLPEYDDSTTLITILRASPSAQPKQLELQHCYLLELADYLINEPPNFTLSANWNKGIKPKTKHLKIVVTRVMGSMFQLDGCGYDIVSQTDTMDSYIGLWLPLASVGIIEEL